MKCSLERSGSLLSMGSDMGISAIDRVKLRKVALRVCFLSW